MNRKIYKFLVVICFILVGCDQEPTIIEHNVNTNTVENVDIENISDVILLHDENNKRIDNDYFTIDIRIGSENICKSNFTISNYDRSQQGVYSSNKSDGTALDMYEEQEIELGSIFGTMKPENFESSSNLNEENLTTVECTVTDENGIESPCINKLKIENYLGYIYQPVYVVKNNTGYFFSLTKE